MNPTIKIVLTDGREINAELYPEFAPNSVANFIELCKSGFYEGMCFHRVIPGFMIQGGGMMQEGKSLKEKRINYTIAGEFKSNGFANSLSHTPGVFSMARTSVKNSASSQFFICVDNSKFLDGEYAAFGKTTDVASLGVAVDISTVKTGNVGYHDDVPLTPIVIAKIEVDTKGAEYETKKLN